MIIDGSTTDSAHDITLTADGDNRHYGLPGQGVVIDLGGLGNDAIQIQDDFVTVEWMEVTNTAGGREGIQVNDGLAAGTSSLVVLRSNLLHDVGGCGVALYDDDGRVDVYNNFVYSNDQCGLYLDPVSLLPGSRFRVLNNTFYANVSNGINKVLGASAAATLLLRGNISVFNGGLDFRGDPLDSVDPASSHNLSSDGTALTHSPNQGAPNGIQEPVLANMNFVDDAAPGIDLHITSGSTAEDVGANLSTIFNFDIDAGARTVPWDIGADDILATTAVELLSFEALPSDAAVDLEWRTGSELDNTRLSFVPGHVGSRLLRADHREGDSGARLLTGGSAVQLSGYGTGERRHVLLQAGRHRYYGQDGATRSGVGDTDGTCVEWRR